QAQGQGQVRWRPARGARINQVRGRLRSTGGAQAPSRAMSGTAVGFAGDEAAGGFDAVDRHAATLSAGQARLAGGLLVVGQPLAVLLLGDEALGSGVGQGVVLVTGDVRQRNGQVAGTGVVDHEYDAQLGQAL